MNDVVKSIVSIGVGKVVVPNGKGLMAALDADDTPPLLETWDAVENDNPQDTEMPNWANDAKFQEFRGVRPVRQLWVLRVVILYRAPRLQQRGGIVSLQGSHESLPIGNKYFTHAN